MILACEIGEDSFTPAITIFSTVFLTQVYSGSSAFFDAGTGQIVTVKAGSKLFIKRIKVNINGIPGLRFNPAMVFNMGLANFAITPAYMPLYVYDQNEWIDLNVEMGPATQNTLIKPETAGGGYAFIAYDGRNLQDVYKLPIPKISAVVLLDADCVTV